LVWFNELQLAHPYSNKSNRNKLRYRLKSVDIFRQIIFCALVSIFISVISYVNYRGHLNFCEEQNNEISQQAKNVKMNTQGNFIYDPFYVSDLSLYDGLCLEGDGAPSKPYTTWGIATLIFIFLAILSWKFDNLKRR